MKYIILNWLFNSTIYIKYKKILIWKYIYLVNLKSVNNNYINLCLTSIQKVRKIVIYPEMHKNIKIVKYRKK